MAIRGLGIRERMPPCLVDRPQGTGDVLLMHFHDPVTVWDGEGRPHACAADTWMTWLPGAAHRFGNAQRAWTHSWIHLTGAAITAALAATSLPSARPQPLPGAPMDHFLPAIHAELGRGRLADPGIINGLIELWLRTVARDARPAGPAVPERLRAVKDFIDGDPSQPLHLPGLAARAGLSASQFGEAFRRHFGWPPMRYLARQRMLHAAHLLRDRNRSVAEVAAQVGFDDPYYFSRAFSAFHGAAPREWRKAQG